MITRTPRDQSLYRPYEIIYDPISQIQTYTYVRTIIQERREKALFALNDLSLSDEEHMPIEDMLFSPDVENLTVAEELINNLNNNGQKTEEQDNERKII